VSWKYLTKSALYGVQLFYGVCVPKKENTTDNDGAGDDEKELQKKKSLVYSLLIAAAGDKHMHLLEHIQEGDAAGIWKALHDKFERETLHSKFILMRKLYRIKQNYNETFEVYVANINRMIRQLKGMGVKVPEDFKMMIMLEGMGDRFASTIELIYSHEKPTFDMACQLLKNTIERTEAQQDTSDSAFHAKSSKPCKYFKAGTCHHGNNCKFSHDNCNNECSDCGAKVSGKFCSSCGHELVSKSKKKVCYQFRDDGTCKWGDKCRFAHKEQQEQSLGVFSF
jgi:hypothetical protein